jgi:catechol 2,3-dioxygenase-like lactoylglutathione lyase family enzyme
VPEKVEFLYSGIRVKDLERSIRFYRALGFRILKRGWFSHGGKWVHLTFPGSPHRIELNYYEKGSVYAAPFGPGEEFDHFGFYAPDPKAWVRKAVRAGATPIAGWMDGPVQLVYVREPNGVWLGAFGPAIPGTTLPGRRRKRPAPRRTARKRRR